MVHYLIWLMFSKEIDKKDGRTDGSFLPPLGTRDFGGDISFLIRKGRDRLFSFSSSFSHLTRLSRPDSVRSSPSSLPTRNGKVVRSSETFGGFFSPTTREVSAYTLCVLLVREEGGGDRDGGERERCVEKMKAENPVRSNSIQATSTFQRFTKVANLRPSTTGRHTCQSITRGTSSPSPA